MSLPAPPPDDPRRLYEETLARALRFAERHVSRDQALEIAHDVASDMAARPPSRISGALIYRAVLNRLRNVWRATQRRAAVERVHQEERADHVAQRVDPATMLETAELTAVIEATLAGMPETMREVFGLIREHELSYKEAAAHLGVAIGTVHTHLSRANGLLRRAIEDYHNDRARPETRAERRS